MSTIEKLISENPILSNPRWADPKDIMTSDLGIWLSNKQIFERKRLDFLLSPEQLFLKYEPELSYKSLLEIQRIRKLLDGIHLSENDLNTSLSKISTLALGGVGKGIVDSVKADIDSLCCNNYNTIEKTILNGSVEDVLDLDLSLIQTFASFGWVKVNLDSILEKHKGSTHESPLNQKIQDLQNLSIYPGRAMIDDIFHAMLRKFFKKEENIFQVMNRIGDMSGILFLHSPDFSFKKV